MKNREFIPALRYHFLTPCYDFFIKILVPEKKIKLKTIELTQVVAGDKILDFGCGTGTLLYLLEKQNPFVSLYGVDIDERMLDKAQLKLRWAKQEVCLVHYLGNKLPFPDNFFDRIVSTWVFHHFTDEQKVVAFNQLFQKLKPGGTLILADWGKAKNYWMRVLFFFVQLVDNFQTTTSNVRGLLPQFIQTAGFEHVEVRGDQATCLGTLNYFVAFKPL